ncbi:hypothetical protein [Scleromatobacter humisilvae]|uniref:Uncharacterized protein n=1 Tax=Scleromatobacter humisilvae TaxID=2897159 RepID=A0A9X2BY89_9BURK|nr:hypothetical protein [Scleromatobacter humisilvae]MCK9685157.1 hypothetical protein [Scleromatobacter humisilvae]
MTHWIGWLELLAEQALLAAALLVVFDGCRRLVREGMTRRAALMVAIGLIPPVADAWLNLNVMHSVRALQADKLAAVALHGREPAGGWEKAASSPEQRTALSYQAATVAYLFEGGHIAVVDAQGARTPFVPAPDQERAREQFVRDEKAAESAAQASYERGLRLFAEAAAFMLAGAAVGWRQRRRA